jgi:cellobiose phosphorylase
MKRPATCPIYLDCRGRWRRRSGARLGWRVVPAGLRRLWRGKVGSKECDEGQIFIEPQGMCIMAGMGLDDGRAAGAGLGQRAPGDGARDRAAAAGLHPLSGAPGRDQLLPAGLQGERQYLLPHQPLDHDRRGHGSGHGDQAFDYYSASTRRRARRSASAPLRALRLRPDDRRSDAPKHGEAKNSWLTGTAAWNYVAITQWILGRHGRRSLRPDRRCGSGRSTAG